MSVRRKNLFVACALALGACGASAQWSGGGSPVIGSGESVTISTPQPAIVRFTDNGTLTFQAGGSVTVTGSVVTAVGSGPGAVGALNMDGGTITKTGSGFLVVGYLGGTGTVTIATGAALAIAGGRVRIAGNEEGQRDFPSRGEMNVSGALSADVVEFTGFFPTNLTPPYVEYAKLALNPNGVVETGQLQKNDCAVSTLLFNGGTLRAKQDAADFVVGRGVMAMVIADGASAVFDTNGRKVTVNPQATPYDTVLSLRGEDGAGASGSGGFVKTGAGALALRLPASCNTFTGAVTVLQGTLDLGRPLADNQPVTVHAGAHFVPRSADDLDNITLVDGGAGARMLYTVAVDTDALDLVALSATFYDDRLGGPLAGTATLSSTLTHAAGAPGNPFRLIGQGGALNLTNTALEAGAVQVEGAGTFNFMGSRAYASGDAGKLVITDGGYRQDQVFALADANAATPAALAFATGRFQAGNSLDVGVNGYGAFAADGTALTAGRLQVGGGTGYAGAFTQSTGVVTLVNESYVGLNDGAGDLTVTGGQFIVNSNLRIASNPGNDTALRPQGSVTVRNALLRCNEFRITSWWPSDGRAKAETAGLLTLLPGGVAEVNGIYKNDDPVSTIIFDGGLLRARVANGDFLSAGQPHGTLRVVAEAGQYAAIDTGANAVTVKRPAGTLVITGPGGLKKLGSGVMTFSANQVSYAGDTAVEAGTLCLGDHDQIPHGPGTGDVRVASNATLDLNGKSETVNRLIGQGLVRSTNAPATLGVLADGSDDAWPRAWLKGPITLDKQGAGTLTLAAALAAPTNLIVSAGTVKLAAAQGFPFYRFKVEGVKSPSTANAMQFSELKLLNDGADVTPTRIGIAYDSTGGIGTGPEVNAFPANEIPDKAVDGLMHAGSTTANKWLDFRAKASRTPADRDRVWLRIDFPTAQKITHYNWATGNDAPERDPAAWRLQGSYDGASWADLDVKTGYAATATRNAWASPAGFPVSSANAADILSDTARVSLAPDATLDLAGLSETVGCLAGSGTVALNQATLTLNTPAGVTSRFDGTLAGTGALVKAGDGTQALCGSNALPGDVTVRGGTLTILGGTPDTWFRLTLRANKGATNVTQVSELALYSGDGVRRNLALTPGGPDAGALLPGQFACPAAYPLGSPGESADKLFDGLAATKWCLINNTPDPADAATHRVVILRLPDGSPEVTAYNLCTANDVPERDPVNWTLESSADGSAWRLADAPAAAAPPAARLAWYAAPDPLALASRAVADSATDVIPDSAAVEVRAGATLAFANGGDALGALRVDMAGAGAITRLTAAPGGSLHLVNASGPPSGWAIPLAVGALANPQALKTWTVYADGQPLRGYALTWDAPSGRLRLLPGGTLVGLR